LESYVSGAGADIDVECSVGEGPFLGADIPVAEIFASQLECHGSRCPGCEADLAESSELLGW
jgi:hypothetical protein